LHDVVHALLTHAGWPLGSEVVHTLPPSAVAHAPQLLAVLVMSTHDPLQTTWLPVQPDAHVYVCPSEGVMHSGAPPSQETPHAPQFDGVFSATHAPLQRL
jgi:hypothetical protein